MSKAASKRRVARCKRLATPAAVRLTDENDSDEILTQGGLFTCSDRNEAAFCSQYLVAYADWASNKKTIAKSFTFQKNKYDQYCNHSKPCYRGCERSHTV
jgi:hypothetical protein